jgi:uncharacterized membrane protein YbhN (UPF0104 family)
MSHRKTISKLVSLVLTGLLLVFSYLYISDIIGKIDQGSLSLNWPLLVCSGVLFIIAYVIFSVHWLLACRILDPKITADQQLAFFASQPYKYLPTSAFTFSFRAIYARKLGVGFKKSSAAQLFENTSLITASITLFGLSYFFSDNKAIFLLLLALGGLTFFLVIKIGSLKLTIKNNRLVVSTKHLLGMFFVAIAAWIAIGLSFVVLSLGLGLPVNLLEHIAANALAFALSILAVFAPGGIGVREVVYSSFGINPAAIIYWRIMTFILDFALGVAAIIKIRLLK